MPEEAEYHYFYALGLEKKGNLADAQTELRLALKYRSDFPESAQALRRLMSGGN